MESDALKTLSEGIAAKLVRVEQERRAYIVRIGRGISEYQLVYWSKEHAEAVAASIRRAIVEGIEEYVSG